MSKYLIATLIVGAALTACGGGGSSSSPPVSDPANTGNANAGADGGSGGSSSEFGTADSTQIRPGVTIDSDQSGCTSNFLYRPNTSTAYIGVAAHCFSLDDDNVDPCLSRTENIGFNNVRIENATRPGTLIYNSWAAMQQSGELVGSDVCTGNDFALVEIHPDDLANIHPSALVYGGPVSLFTGLANIGDGVFNFGQSDLHGGNQDLQEREGEIVGITNSGWTYRIETDNAGLPGDSGSAVLHESGRALAALVTVGVSIGFNTSVNNGAVNLQMALNYAINGGFIPASTVLLTSNDFNR